MKLKHPFRDVLCYVEITWKSIVAAGTVNASLRAQEHCSVSLAAEAPAQTGMTSAPAERDRGAGVPVAGGHTSQPPHLGPCPGPCVGRC